MKILNINALFKELIRRGTDSNYMRIHSSVNGNGDKGLLSDKEKKELLSIIEDTFKTVKSNISKS